MLYTLSIQWVVVLVLWVYPTPDVRSFRVAGIFHTGMYEYDTKWTYVLIEEAQKFLKLDDKVNGIEVQVHDIDNAPDLAFAVQTELDYPFFLRHWMELNSKIVCCVENGKDCDGIDTVSHCDGGIAEYRRDTHLGCSYAWTRNIDFACNGCIIKANLACFYAGRCHHWLCWNHCGNNYWD